MCELVGVGDGEVSITPAASGPQTLQPATVRQHRCLTSQLSGQTLCQSATERTSWAAAHRTHRPLRERGGGQESTSKQRPTYLMGTKRVWQGLIIRHQSPWR